MRGRDVRERLHSGACVYGTHVASLMNPVAAAMATEVALDFAFVCTEHMPLGRSEVSMMCQFYAAHGTSPIVRVPCPDPSAMGMAIDGGAEGIVVPYVETVDQVKAAVGAVKYRPVKGRQLEDVLEHGRSRLPEKTQQFLERFNRELYLIIGVESVAAIERLEALIGIDGVDGVFLGPHDITTSMGIPEEYDHPDFLRTVEQVIQRCRRQGVGVGLHTPLLAMGEATVRRLFEAGMNFVINGADITAMRNAMNEQLAQLRRLAGDEPADRTAARSPEETEPVAKSCIG